MVLLNDDQRHFQVLLPLEANEKTPAESHDKDGAQHGGANDAAAEMGKATNSGSGSGSGSGARATAVAAVSTVATAAVSAEAQASKAARALQERNEWTDAYLLVSPSPPSNMFLGWVPCNMQRVMFIVLCALCSVLCAWIFASSRAKFVLFILRCDWLFGGP